MHVVKRVGTTEPVNFGKIQNRLQWMRDHPSVLTHVNAVELSQRVIQSLRDGIHTSEIDAFSSDVSVSLSATHTDYAVLAGRIAINNHHKNTLNSFRDKIDMLYMRKDAAGTVFPLVTDEFYKFVKKHHFEIEKVIDYSRDYLTDYFGFKTLEKGYLLRIGDTPIERPQDMWMRVAIQLHMNTDKSTEKVLQAVFSAYHHMSQKYYTHATPTLFNAATPNGNLSSCFLLSTADSRKGIMKTLDDCTLISKWGGGIGFHMSMWRATGSLIRGTNGASSGIVPFLRMFNDGARAFNQGGKRMGSFAAYIEPHHADIFKFLELRRNEGDENLRARDLFLALWVSDLFMSRVEEDGSWSTFCPDECPGLNTCWGDEYKTLYLQYEAAGKSRETYPARELWKAVYDSQKECGMPYILYKDTINRSNMQCNLGTISSSNLCTEITLFSNDQETAVCNLASICLPKFVEDTHSPDELALEERRVLDHDFPRYPVFNYTKLLEIVGHLVVNLNHVIDKNSNPIIESARSNFMHRPIGIGIQGLADVFLKFRVPFDSAKARDLNKRIAETIYFGALSKSTEMCRDQYKAAVQSIRTTGKPYTQKYFTKEVRAQFPDLKREESKLVCNTVEEVPSTVGAYPSFLHNEGSPLAAGRFHWELHGLEESELSGMYDWRTLREHIMRYGVRNSLLVALMPTASTAQIMGNTSCFEPYLSNLFKRQTLAGEFIVVNKYLIHDLQESGLWSTTMKQYLIANNGSIQHIEGIPQTLKDLYKTVWELSQRCIIDMAADRQPFVDQSQSMNLFSDNFTFDRFNSMQFYGWKHALKTGCYYLRTQPATMAQKFTLDVDLQKQAAAAIQAPSLDLVPSAEPQDLCLLCSS